MKIPKRASECQDHPHSHGCACRKWAFDQAVTALHIIRVWARCDSESGESREQAMQSIADKAGEVLELIKVRQ